MEWSLLNIKNLGFNPKVAIDVGAYNGEWTAMFKKIFPDARVLMVEAQNSKADNLKNLTTQLPGTAFHIGLLGATSGQQIVFNINETVSSALPEYKENTFAKETRTTESLDDVIAKAGTDFNAPDFIKLDVQGYELEVLKGAAGAIKTAQFILCEVSLIEINKGAPLIAEVIAFMNAKGFAVYDICSFIRRPLDRALWQTDILFVNKTNPLAQNKHWN